MIKNVVFWDSVDERGTSIGCGSDNGSALSRSSPYLSRKSAETKDATAVFDRSCQLGEVGRRKRHSLRHSRPD